MEFSAHQLAEVLHATIEGNPDVTVNTLSKIEEGKPGSLSFLANPKYTHFIYDTRASIVIVSRDFMPERPVGATLLRVENPYACFAQLLEMYNQITQNKKGISSLAFISPTAKVAEDVYVGEFAVIADGAEIGKGSKIYPQVYVGDRVTIGEGSILYPGVKVYSDNVIGKFCTLHSGAVIGADGFGFAPNQENVYAKIPQTGNVILEDHVDIGANTCIDRATLGSTIIRKGVKLDNLIQVAHNVEIGENTVIAAQTAIAGSSKVGKNCMFGGQAGITGHVSVADEVKIAAQSGIETSIKEVGAVIMGSPAFNIRKFHRSYVHFKNLSDIVSRLDALEKKLKEQ